MTKLDPIVSEFATQEEADAYDKWFRAEVEAALKEEGPGIPHDEVMRDVRAMLDSKRNARRSLEK